MNVYDPASHLLIVHRRLGVTVYGTGVASGVDTYGSLADAVVAIDDWLEDSSIQVFYVREGSAKVEPFDGTETDLSEAEWDAELDSGNFPARADDSAPWGALSELAPISDVEDVDFVGDDATGEDPVCKWTGQPNPLHNPAGD